MIITKIVTSILKDTYIRFKLLTLDYTFYVFKEKFCDHDKRCVMNVNNTRVFSSDYFSLSHLIDMTEKDIIFDDFYHQKNVPW